MSDSSAIIVDIIVHLSVSRRHPYVFYMVMQIFGSSKLAYRLLLVSGGSLSVVCQKHQSL